MEISGDKILSQNKIFQVLQHVLRMSASAPLQNFWFGLKTSLIILYNFFYSQLLWGYKRKFNLKFNWQNQCHIHKLNLNVTSMLVLLLFKVRLISNCFNYSKDNKIKVMSIDQNFYLCRAFLLEPTSKK